MIQGFHPRRFFPSTLGLCVAAAGLLLGAAVPAYVMALDDSVGKLLAFPALMLLTLLLAYNRTMLLLLIVVVRGSTETLFAESRFAVGGAQIGLGGLLNAFAIFIAVLLVLEQPGRFSKTLLRVWSAFLVVCLIGIADAPERGDAIRLMLQLLSDFAVFVGASYFVRTREDFDRAVKLVIWSSVIPSLYGLYQFATGGGYDTQDAGMRINATFSHPNVFAFYLTLVISLVFYVLKSGKLTLNVPSRCVFVLYLGVLFALLVLTKTRSAWVACVAGFFAYGLFFERRYLLYLVVGGVAALFVPEVGDRLFDLTQNTGQALSSRDQLNSFAWRVLLWSNALDYMDPIRYLYGYGLEGFSNLSQTFFVESGGVNWGAHNVYVEIFFELGILGIGAFLWMYGQLLRSLRPMLAFDRMGAFTLMFVIIEYLVVCTSDNMLHYLSFNWYLWFLYGAGISLTELNTAPSRAAERSPEDPGYGVQRVR